MKLKTSCQFFKGKKTKTYGGTVFIIDSLVDSAILKAIGRDKIELGPGKKPLADYPEKMLFDEETVQAARLHLLQNWKKFEGSTPYNFYQTRKFMAYMVTSYLSNYLMSKKCTVGNGAVTFLNRKVLQEMIKTGKFSTHSQLVEVMEKIEKNHSFHTLELKSHLGGIDDKIWEIDFFHKFTEKERSIIEALSGGYTYGEISKTYKVSCSDISRVKASLRRHLIK